MTTAQPAVTPTRPPRMPLTRVSTSCLPPCCSQLWASATQPPLKLARAVVTQARAESRHCKTFINATLYYQRQFKTIRRPELDHVECCLVAADSEGAASVEGQPAPPEHVEADQGVSGGSHRRGLVQLPAAQPGPQQPGGHAGRGAYTRNVSQYYCQKYKTVLSEIIYSLLTTNQVNSPATGDVNHAQLVEEATLGPQPAGRHAVNNRVH